MDIVQLPPTKKDPKGFQQTQLSGDAVKVSLQDCLACSGCVTSAETVLLEHQSTGELLAALQSNKTVIVSVSPQSRSSLGVLHQLSPSQTASKLVHFLKSLGVKVVLDTTSSRDIALLEAAQEFIARYVAKHPEHATSAESSGIPATPVDLSSCLTCWDNAIAICKCISTIMCTVLSVLNFRAMPAYYLHYAAHSP